MFSAVPQSQQELRNYTNVCHTKRGNAKSLHKQVFDLSKFSKGHKAKCAISGTANNSDSKFQIYLIDTDL